MPITYVPSHSSDLEITLTGPPGSGKTVFAQYLAKHFDSLGFSVVVIDNTVEADVGKEDLIEHFKSKPLVISTAYPDVEE